MNRGRRFEKIFNNPDDYDAFVELLKGTSEIWNIRIAAYCLMPNHYHLLVRTPDANISRSMRHLNGIYTQDYNRRHKCDGTLFRGRYKSILVSADSYLLQLVRYIHRNSLKAGIVKKLNDYKWSSHKGYLSVTQKWDWIDKQFILSMLTRNKKIFLREYKKFIRTDCDENISESIDGKRWPISLGPTEFIDWVKGAYYSKKTDDEVPQAKLLAPDVEQIVKRVCENYNIDGEALFISRRGVFNEPRNVAVYLCRLLRRDRLTEICGYFHMQKYSSVSSIIERVKARMKIDNKFKSRVEKLSDIITKSQGQT